MLVLLYLVHWHVARLNFVWDDLCQLLLLLWLCILVIRLGYHDLKDSLQVVHLGFLRWRKLLIWSAISLDEFVKADHDLDVAILLHVRTSTDMGPEFSLLTYTLTASTWESWTLIHFATRKGLHSRAIFKTQPGFFLDVNTLLHLLAIEVLHVVVAELSIILLLLGLLTNNIRITKWIRLFDIIFLRGPYLFTRLWIVDVAKRITIKVSILTLFIILLLFVSPKRAPKVNNRISWIVAGDAGTYIF